MGTKFGRPIKWTPSKIKELYNDLEKYLYEQDSMGEYVNSVPSISEFAFKHHISRQRLYEFEELSELIAICKTKKEHDLETGALSGQLNYVMAIFSLKQLGWTDRPSGDSDDRLIEALDKVLKGVRGELQR
jgi:hypothetical protein